MIVGVGNDIVEIDRINLIYKKFGEKFLNKVYTRNELNFFNQNKSRLIYRLANRFAAKEAFYKALNHNKKSRIPSFKDVEILNDNLGKPYFKLNNKTKKIILKTLKVKNFDIFLSISDEKEYSIAFTIIQAKDV